ncbi:MAG: MBOAT family protein [Lachnospiraceae bacterium]|jgi:alginate O-acetyltransferase complex protein AlgI|nr:MBOAT family protein [Lachnospiraceae bacterium]
MGFTSLVFLVFFPIVYLVYLLMPPKGRAFWLLIASYGFCISFGLKYAVILLISTLGTWLAGIAAEKRQGEAESRWITGAAVLLHVLLLCFFKYNGSHPVLPVGLSFYTFQAIGYLADVYRGTVRAERNLIRFGLFQAFFPKLVQGPIERSQELLGQIRELEKKKLLDPERMREGMLLLLWGLFQKLVIADRAAVAVNAVYGQFGAFGGGEILLATLLYAFQLYCDFAGYTNMARGIAGLCGIELTENFRRPYLAVSVREFWHRWHISLSSWLRDYVYIPLGGSRNGKLRRYMNVMLTFLVSGIWHGTGFHFLLWGCMHGAVQLAETAWEKLPRILRWCLTFGFINVSWMVFRVNSLGDLRGMLKLLVTDMRFRDPAGMGLGGLEWLLLVLGLFLAAGKDLLNEKGFGIRKWLSGRGFFVRLLVYTALLSGIVVFGVYGAAYDTGGFLYTQF